ncbi:hypothetical protein P2318_03480 [Myxococcaceae bacterium GXIMD 01537]
MEKTHIRSKPWRLKALWLASTLLTVSGCAEEAAAPPAPDQQEGQRTQEAKEGEDELGGVILDQAKDLPFVDGKESATLFAQRLKAPTKNEENIALHMKLPPTFNRELKDSLVRVIGEPERPVVLFRSDVLEKAGLIEKSPGEGFFTTLANVSEEELETRVKNEEVLASGKFGEPVKETVLFDGRLPIARTNGIRFDLPVLNGGGVVPLTACPSQPASTAAAWAKSLLINDAAVVLDPARTWDPCTNQGTRGGKWTFAYLMREMAQTSGKTPEDFVKDWLSLWVNPQVINGDTVAARTQMFNQVIQPWATASGLSSALVVNPTTGKRDVLLSGPLNLEIAPFRLLAIVNRLDLARRGPGQSGYGGPITEQPQDGGELRFVFGVVRPTTPLGTNGGTEATCGLRPFTVIFEYGVPKTGCGQVVAWAKKWTQLNTFASFDAAYLTQLQSITEDVVPHGKAPGKGNKNAINQIRTNENALDPAGIWELREFTLSIEDPVAETDTPASGPLRNHTVAQTPNDGAYAFNSAPINQYILNDVLSGVTTPVGPLPTNCSASYTVPFSFNGLPFRGGNALVRPPTHWRATGASASAADEVCARFQFSSNTCNGCHFGDSGTTSLNPANNPPPTGNLGFVHISPTSGIPAKLSKFLTGGGTGFMFGVNDTQFGASPTWQFADLDARFKNLYKVAFCTQCSRVVVFNPGLVDQFVQIAGRVPIDGLRKGNLPVGPVTDFEVAAKMLEVMPQFAKDFRDEPVDFIRPAQGRVH